MRVLVVLVTLVPLLALVVLIDELLCPNDVLLVLIVRVALALPIALVLTGNSPHRAGRARAAARARCSPACC